MYSIKVYPLLKSKANKTESKNATRRLYCQIDVLKHKSRIDHFHFSFYDEGKSIHLQTNQLNDKTIINHPKSIRLNTLLEFLKSEGDLIIQNLTQEGGLYCRETLRLKLEQSQKQSFEDYLTERLQTQLVTVSIGADASETITVHKAAVEAVDAYPIPEPISINEDGSVEVNDWTEEDYEVMLRWEHHKINKQMDNLRKQRLAKRIKNMTSEQRYKEGYFDKSNIFHVFGSIYYNPKINYANHKIVIRLLQYMVEKSPSQNIKDLNKEWIKEFFYYLKDRGYYDVSTIKLEPLNFNVDIFKDKELKKYSHVALEKLYQIFKCVYRQLVDEKLLTEMDFSNLNITSYLHLNKNRQPERVKHRCTLEEFIRFSNFQFDPNKIDDYNELFKRNSESLFRVSIEHLSIGRDLYILQTMGGGLRGYLDLLTMKFSAKENTLSFSIGKKEDKLMINPLNEFTKVVAERYDYKLPNLNLPFSINTQQHIYRALLRTIAEIVGLDRGVPYEKELVPLYEVFLPRTARKTFCQILHTNFQFSNAEISLFSDHDNEGDSILNAHYLDNEDIEKKHILSQKIKIENAKIAGANGQVGAFISPVLS